MVTNEGESFAGGGGWEIEDNNEQQMPLDRAKAKGMAKRFTNLCSRFPGVPQEKVLAALEKFNGHGGYASDELATLKEVSTEIVPDPFVIPSTAAKGESSSPLSGAPMRLNSSAIHPTSSPQATAMGAPLGGIELQTRPESNQPEFTLGSEQEVPVAEAKEEPEFNSARY